MFPRVLELIQQWIAWPITFLKGILPPEIGPPVQGLAAYQAGDGLMRIALTLHQDVDPNGVTVEIDGVDRTAHALAQMGAFAVGGGGIPGVGPLTANRFDLGVANHCGVAQPCSYELQITAPWAAPNPWHVGSNVETRIVEVGHVLIGPPIQVFNGSSPVDSGQIDLELRLHDDVDPNSVAIEVDGNDRTADALASVGGPWGLGLGSPNFITLGVVDKCGGTATCNYTVTVTADWLNRGANHYGPTSDSSAVAVDHPDPRTSAKIAGATSGERV